MGKKVAKVLRGSGMTKVAFANKIATTRGNVYGLLKRPDIDAPLLRRISSVLGHDFFQYLTETSEVQEDPAKYETKVEKSNSTIKIVIDIDPNDADRLEESGFLRRLSDLIKEIS